MAWLRGSPRRDVADVLLRTEVAMATGLTAEDVHVHRLCPWCGSSDHGRPFVVRRDQGPAPFVSLSRTDDVVIVALSDAGPVGVDIERLDAARFPGFSKVALHEAERGADTEEDARTWVRKESLLKATGDGLQVDPRLLRVSDPRHPPRLLEWAGRPEPPPVQMCDLQIDGYAACLTVLATEPPQLTMRQEASGALSA